MGDREKTEESFKGKAGLKLVRKEVKEQTKEDLRTCKDEYKAANNKNRKAENDLQNMQKRKSVYDEKPASVELHGFTSLRQAQQALAKVEKVQQEAEQELNAVEEKEGKLKMRKKLSSKKWREEAMIAIVDEKREEERRRIVQDHRIEAMKMGWRRPWDGENGEDFVRWVAARKGGEDDLFGSDASDTTSEDDEDNVDLDNDDEEDDFDGSTVDDESSVNTHGADESTVSDNDDDNSTVDDSSIVTGGSDDGSTLESSYEVSDSDGSYSEDSDGSESQETGETDES